MIVIDVLCVFSFLIVHLFPDSAILLTFYILYI